jgi:hypothetical protein
LSITLAGPSPAGWLAAVRGECCRLRRPYLPTSWSMKIYSWLVRDSIVFSVALVRMWITAVPSLWAVPGHLADQPHCQEPTMLYRTQRTERFCRVSYMKEKDGLPSPRQRSRNSRHERCRGPIPCPQPDRSPLYNLPVFCRGFVITPRKSVIEYLTEVYRGVAEQLCGCDPLIN